MLREHLVNVGIKPVIFELQVGLTQSSCMSAGSRVKSGSDVAADDSAGDCRSGEANREAVCVCAPA